MIRKIRNELLQKLEEANYKLVKDLSPDEYDIPGAMEYYRTLTIAALEEELEGLTNRLTF